MVRVNERYIGRVEYRVFYSSPSDRRTGRPRAYIPAGINLPFQAQGTKRQHQWFFRLVDYLPPSHRHLVFHNPRTRYQECHFCSYTNVNRPTLLFYILSTIYTHRDTSRKKNRELQSKSSPLSVSQGRRLKLMKARGQFRSLDQYK